MIKVCGLHLDNSHATPYVSETERAADRQHFLELLFVTVFVPDSCILCHTPACSLRNSLVTLGFSCLHLEQKQRKKNLWCNLFHCSLYYEQAKEQTFCFYSSIFFFAKCAQFLIEIQIWMVLLIFLRYKVISPAAVSRLCFWRWNPSGVIKLTLRNVSKKEMNSCQSHSSLFIQPNNGNVWKSASRKVKWADLMTFLPPQHEGWMEDRPGSWDTLSPGHKSCQDGFYVKGCLSTGVHVTLVPLAFLENRFLAFPNWF